MHYFLFIYSSKEQNNSLQAIRGGLQGREDSALPMPSLSPSLSLLRALSLYEGVQRGEEEAAEWLTVARRRRMEASSAPGVRLRLRHRYAVAVSSLCVRAWLPQAIEGGRAAVGCAAGMTQAV